MEMEDSIKSYASNNSPNGSQNSDSCQSGCETIECASIPQNSEVTDKINREVYLEKEKDKNIPILPIGFEPAESVAVLEQMASTNSVYAENGSLSVRNETALSNHERDSTLLSQRELNANSLSGVKRSRETVDEDQPSVHVIYSCLPRESKQKLEELLQQWSRWHTQSCSLSDDSNRTLESGEETYFPALNIGLDMPSAVTFWVDNQTNIPSKEIIPLNGASVPLYDRGYSLALTSTDGSCNMNGGLEKLDTSRCFNCGSYSHALKNCPKPRDNDAVNNARKLQKSRRNQSANSRNSTRYYQSSQGGKYEGLTPGKLDAETRKALGLGELDPPPWLERMRKIGYPPGYIDTDAEDQPSGITIFCDEENMEESKVETPDASLTEPARKKTVEFPGINAPIPENADERLWVSIASGFSQSRDHMDHSSEYPNGRHYTEERWSRDLERDWPPRYDYGSSPSWSSRFYSEYSLTRTSRPWSPSYSSSFSDRGRSPRMQDVSDHFPRYGDHELSYNYQSPHAGSSRPWSPSHRRSFPDTGRRNPIVHDDSPRYGNNATSPYWR